MEANFEIAYISSKMKNDHHAHNSPAWCGCSIQLAPIRGFQIDDWVKNPKTNKQEVLWKQILKLPTLAAK